MRKKLLTLGALALAMSMNAQFQLYVGDQGQVFVKEGALVFNGGGVKTAGAGLVDNSGNFMVVGSTTDKFETKTTKGANKTTGGNFILRMTNETIGSLRYGQLYITGLTQDNITGIVDKQYKDTNHGEYQQIAFPFYKKNFGELTSEFGKSFSNRRWTKNEILVWNNKDVYFEDLKYDNFTTDVASLNGGKASTAYFAIGAANFDASAQVRTVKGVPYADNITETLSGAGASVNFGTEGNGINKKRERYYSYLQDSWAVAQGEIWTGNYGKDIYQFGNPFLTNLDLGLIAQEQEDIIGIRVESVYDTDDSKYNEGFRGQGRATRYVNIDDNGKAIGDINAVIRPMQTFVVKTQVESSVQIDFDKLRRFAYTPQDNDAATVTTGLQTSSLRTNALRTNSLRSASVGRTLSNASSYVLKQLGVIALDANGNEIGRTYYYVSPLAVTGAEPSNKKRQTSASGTDIIGTFEENKAGGYDEAAANKYWLYINEANENDYKGKDVRMKLYSDDVKSLKFEIREDAKLIADNTSLSNGESFYIKAENGELQEVKQGMVIASNTDTYDLFYGKPETKVEKVEEPVVIEEARRENTELVFDQNTGEYKLLFASDWEEVRVTVVSLRGKIVVPTKVVSAKEPHTVELPKNIGTYVVRALNEKGKVFSKKVLKN